MAVPKRKSSRSNPEVSFGAWLAGTRWGLKMFLGVIAGLITLLVFWKQFNDAGLLRYWFAHRGYVDDEILNSALPLKNGVVEIRSQLANGRLNQIDQQLLDNEIAKLKARNTPAEVTLNAQSDRLKRERDETVRLLQSLGK